MEVSWKAHQTTNPNENEHIKQHIDSLNEDEHQMNFNCSDDGSQSSANCDDEDEIVAELETFGLKFAPFFII